LENAPALQLNRHYIIYIEESGTLGDRFGVEITGTTCDP
jgi:hypothetical protein